MEPMNWAILIKYLANECSADQNKLIKEWINESESNKVYFEELKRIWEVSGKEKEIEFPGLEKAWIKVDKATIPNHRSLKPSYFQYWKIAATILLVSLLSFLVYFYTFSTKQLLVKTNDNEKKEVLLVDGSKIWLNENSSLEYPEDFAAGSREVKLNGEAFFEIAKNDKKPFYISTGNSITKVVGTSFNIKEIKSESVHISVVTGAVSFYDKNFEEKQILLHPGDKGELTASSIKAIKLNDTNFLSWYTGILSFKSTTIKNVIPELENYYDVKFILENQEFKKCLLTTTFKKSSLLQVLQTLQTIFGISFEIKGNIVFLKNSSC